MYAENTNLCNLGVIQWMDRFPPILNMNVILVFLCDLFQINYQTYKKQIIQIGQVFLKILKNQQLALMFFFRETRVGRPGFY